MGNIFDRLCQRLPTQTCLIAVALLLAVDGSLYAQSSRSSDGTPLYSRTPEMQHYRLFNPRIEQNSQRETVLVFNFEKLHSSNLTSEELMLRILGTGKDTASVTSLWASPGKEYKIRLDEDSAALVKAQGAVVFASGDISGTHFLLSNSIAFGNTSQEVSASPSGPPQTAIVAKAIQRVKDAGPAYTSVPQGYTLVSTTNIYMPGMSAKVFLEGDWRDAEYIGEDGYRRPICRLDPNSRAVLLTESFNVAVPDEQIKIARKNMEFYKPSLQLVPDTSVVVPEEFELKEHRVRLQIGAPVRIYLVHGFGKGRFYDGFVINADYDITVRGVYIPGGEVVVSKHKIMLTKDVQQKLIKSTSADAKSYFGKFLEASTEVSPMEAAGRRDLELSASTYENPNSYRGPTTTIPTPKSSEKIASAMHKSAMSNQAGPLSDAAAPNESATQPIDEKQARVLKPYPVEINPLPKCTVLDNEVPLRPGLQLGCSWSQTWYPVTVLAAHNDGSVRIRWTTFGEAWDADVARSSLIILDTEKRKLLRQSDANDVVPRLWKDQSEKFSVLAYLDSVSEGKIRLLKVDGTALDIPLDKLSDSDKELANLLVD